MLRGLYTAGYWCGGVLLVCFSGYALAVWALPADVPLEDAAQEARAQHISRQLRCMVCEGQSIYESDAALARAMRQAVRVQVARGVSDEDIYAYFVTRYGEEVLTHAPMSARTLWVWMVPLICLLAGGGIMWRYGRRTEA